MKTMSVNKVITQPVDITKAVIQPISDDLLYRKNVAIDVLRLDLIHPVISGNKWFKLKYQLQEAVQQNKKGLLTFGGAWSNHLVATALAGAQANLSTLGVIRGERPATLSDTLQEVQAYGMQLQFISRSAYANEAAIIPLLQKEYPDHYIVPQGGQSHLGVLGAAEIGRLAQIESYSHICCATGTGTMLAGLVHAALPHQQVLGICSLKIPNDNNNSLNSFVNPYAAWPTQYTIFYDYHFGGYARKTDELIQFMNSVYLQHELPTDFVYTGKLFFGVMQLVQTDYFKPGSRILLVHSGGVQGNRSLPAGTLTYL
jgi:D-cysteine desulfhydrase